jgi:hypothetical protein
MVKRLFGTYPLLKVDIQHSLNQVFSGLTNMTPFSTSNVVGPSFNTTQNFSVLEPAKRHFTGKENVQYHTTGPDIAFLVVITLDYFRSQVVYSSLAHSKVSLSVIKDGSPKIDKLND